MSWLGRLLGRAPAAPTTSAAATTVTIADDLAAQLTASGAPLAEAVEAALRAHLAEADNANGGKPFWLAREENDADIEERLRDRIAQRRAGDGEAER